MRPVLSHHCRINLPHTEKAKNKKHPENSRSYITTLTKKKRKKESGKEEKHFHSFQMREQESRELNRNSDGGSHHHHHHRHRHRLVAHPHPLLGCLEASFSGSFLSAALWYLCFHQKSRRTIKMRCTRLQSRDPMKNTPMQMQMQIQIQIRIRVRVWVRVRVGYYYSCSCRYRYRYFWCRYRYRCKWTELRWSEETTGRQTASGSRQRFNLIFIQQILIAERKKGSSDKRNEGPTVPTKVPITLNTMQTHFHLFKIDTYFI